MGNEVADDLFINNVLYSAQQGVSRMTQPIAYGLVRDKAGNPKIDDPSTLPPEIISMLTKDEKISFGLATPKSTGG